MRRERPVSLPPAGKNFLSYRWSHVLVSLWAGYAGYTMARRPFSVARSEVEAETGISKFESSTVDTAFLLAYTVAQLMYGSYLKGTFSPRTILIVGLLGSAFSCALVAVSSSALMFTVAWALNGRFQAAGWASCMTVLTPWLTSNERGRVMGIWGTNMAAGGVLGNFITSFLMGRGYSWRAAVGMDVCILLVVAAYMHATLVHHPNLGGFLSSKQASDGLSWDDLQRASREGHFNMDGEFLVTMPRGGSSTSEGAAATTIFTASNSVTNGKPPVPPGAAVSAAASTDGKISFLDTMRIPGIAAISASYFFHKLVRYALMFWLPYYFHKELHYSTATAGYIAAFVDVGGVLGSMLSGVFSDWYAGGRRRAMATLFFVAGMAASTYLFSALSGALHDNAPVCCLVAALVGFFAFAIDSLMSGSYLQDYCERIHVLPYLGAISGVVGGIGSAGSIAQGYLTVAFSAASWNVLFLVLAAMTVLAGALMWTPIRAETAALRHMTSSGASPA